MNVESLFETELRKRNVHAVEVAMKKPAISSGTRRNVFSAWRPSTPPQLGFPTEAVTLCDLVESNMLHAAL